MNAPDFGPLVTRRRDGRLSAPSHVTIEDRPDPDQPNRTIRGAHRTDPLMRILGNGMAHKNWPDEDRRRYQAAETFRDDLAIAAGAKAATGETMPSCHVGGPWSYGPQQKRVDAIGMVRQARSAIPEDAVAITDWVVIGHNPIRDFREARGRKHGVIRALLMDGLDALAGFYEGIGR